MSRSTARPHAVRRLYTLAAMTAVLVVCAVAAALAAPTTIDTQRAARLDAAEIPLPDVASTNVHPTAPVPAPVPAPPPAGSAAVAPAPAGSPGAPAASTPSQPAAPPAAAADTSETAGTSGEGAGTHTQAAPGAEGTPSSSASAGTAGSTVGATTGDAGVSPALASGEPSSAGAPVMPAGHSRPTQTGRLTWAPPRLDDPITVRVSASKSTLRLDNHRDYLIDMPDTVLRTVNGLTITGGRDVVLIGGHIEAREAANGAARGLYLKDQTGTVHVEGLRLSGDRATEGINLDQRRGATVQLQNIEVGTVRGSYAGHHADVLQTWAGPDVLRVDRLEGSTTYQGFFLDPKRFLDRAPSLFDFRNVVLRDSGRTSAYLLWQSGRFPISTENVTVARNPSKGFPKYVVRSQTGSWNEVIDGGSATPSPLLGTPGLSYTSPGYGS